MKITPCKILLVLLTLPMATLMQPLAYAQSPVLWVKNKIHQFTTSEKDSTRSDSFILLPALGYAQESGVEYGVASTYNFYTDKKNLLNRTSNITLIGTMTTKSQKNIKLTSDIWSPDNSYHLMTELRYRDWPFQFYGIGSDTWEADKDAIDQKLVRAKVDLERRVLPKLYIGINVNYEKFSFRDQVQDGIFNQEQVIGKTGGQHLSLGTSLLYDSRNLTTYTTKGFFARLKYGYSPDFWAKDNFSGSLIETDFRAFFPLHSKVTLAAQALYRGTISQDIPFYMLRDLGGDMHMRGYYAGRYKDRNYISAQAELRYQFIPRLGVVGFAGSGTTSSPQHDMRWLPSYGAGIRYFFSLEHKSTVRLDYAYGEQRTGEQRQSGFYLSISEAF